MAKKALTGLEPGPKLRAVQSRRDTEVSIAGSGIPFKDCGDNGGHRGRTRERPREARVTPRPDPRSAALREAALKDALRRGARAGVECALRPGVAHLKDDRGGARAGAGRRDRAACARDCGIRGDVLRVLFFSVVVEAVFVRISAS